eukprot:scaffold53374_cov72-Cyclotella_meneghiniana.AAC.3
MDLFIESVGDAFSNNLVSASQAHVNINAIGTGVGSDSELAIKRDAYALTASNLLTDSNIIGDVSTRHALQQAFGAAGGGKYGTNTVSGVDIQELRERKRAVGGKASFSTFANNSTSTPSVARAHSASVSDLSSHDYSARDYSSNLYAARSSGSFASSRHHPNATSRIRRNDLMMGQMEQDEALARELSQQYESEYPANSSFNSAPTDSPLKRYKSMPEENHATVDQTPDMIVRVRKKNTATLASNMDIESPATISSRFELNKALSGKNKNALLCQTITESGLQQSQEAADFALKSMKYISKND